MSHLFEPFVARGVTLRNRIAVSPMCQYSCEEGMPTDWHLVHLGSRAVGGAALVHTEAAAVTAVGRISPSDAGIWNEAQAAAWEPITRFITQQGAAAGMQLAHAGRKASTPAPWKGGAAMPDSEGGWEPIAPSPVAFADNYRLPREMTLEDMEQCAADFAAAAVRAWSVGFRWLEIHAAHGYLLHQFLSPLSNQRTDRYGGSFGNRIRLLMETVAAINRVRADWSPLAVRLSCTDWAEGGWDIDQSVELARILKTEGVDLIDCSSGGSVPHPKIPVGAGYQTPFAERIRDEAGVATAAVGMIAEPMQADEIVRNGPADLVYLGREMLRDPYWPIHASRTLGSSAAAPVPVQYERAY